MTDARGLETSITDYAGGTTAGIQRTYEYDWEGDVTKEKELEGNYKTFTYDSKGRNTVIKYHQAYGTETLKTAYTYDVNDQVTLMEDYENNCLDQLTESVCGNISKTYEYDLNGNQISETSREQGTEKAQQLFDYDEEVPDFTTTTRDTTIRRTPDSCRRIHTGETLPSRIHFICMRTARTILSTMLILQGI